MKLHLRLALPLLVTAVIVTAAVTIGMIVLVRGTVSAVLRQSGRQMARITENALNARAQNLNEIAMVFGVLRGDIQTRDRAWKHVPLDAAAIINRKTGQVISAMGASINPKDLKGLLDTQLPGPPILRIREGLLIAGVSPDEKQQNLVVVGQRLGPEFVKELKGLLQTNIEVKADGRPIASTLTGDFPSGTFYPVNRAFSTPGGADIEVTMHMPAREVYQTRRMAFFFTIGGGLTLLLIALSFYAYSLVRVTRPIRDLIAATERVAAGDLEASLDPGAPAELGALMREFNTMARSLKETQEKLIHSAKLSSVGQMVAGISHELNNPLHGLLGHAEHLATKFPPGDPTREKLDTVVREAQRMKRILADLRGFTRPSGQDRARIDLNQVVREVLALSRHDAEKAGVSCELALHEGDAVVMASPDQIRQVLLNLYLNALQAMPQGGRLKVTTSHREQNGRQMCVVAVEDTGAGIPPDIQSRVKEPFFSTKPGRIGLGLSICQEIISQHDGTLLIDSKPGEGTRVTFNLPAADSR